MLAGQAAQIPDPDLLLWLALILSCLPLTETQSITLHVSASGKSVEETSHELNFL